MPPEYPQWAEIEAVSRAIKRSGRPMALSLSPGKNITPEDVRRSLPLAQLYRVTADFWDRWPQVAYLLKWLPQFLELAGPGHWPDGDMLPFGRIGAVNTSCTCLNTTRNPTCCPRQTRLTPGE